MENRPVNVYQKPELHGPTGRALLACGLWMRLGFIGASGVAVGVIQLFGNEGSPLAALAFVLGGAALAAVSWRRAHAALSKVDVPGAETAPSASSGARRVASA